MTPEGSPKPRGVRKYFIPALAVFILLCIPFGCLGYLRWWYPFWTERAINTHRSFYESIIRQIEQDAIPPRTTVCYRLGEAGTVARLTQEQVKGDFYFLIKDATVARAERRSDGSLLVRIPVYGDDLTQYGLLYGSAAMTAESAKLEIGPEGTVSPVDEHWWTYNLWLGH